MKTILAATLLFLTPAPDCPAQGRTVTVFVTDSVLISSTDLVHAEAVATQILSTADVRLVFRSGLPKQETPFAFVAGIRNGASEYFKPGALAYAEPYGNSIVILYDRIAAIHRANTSDILGHVLAHEIVHMLRGDTAHSSVGLMKPHWTGDDYFEMMTGRRLGMTEDDIDAIHTGYASMEARAIVASRHR
jgi:hypothetical protein